MTRITCLCTSVAATAALALASIAAAGGTCGPGNGDCCVANGTPGCDDIPCCEAVCAFDAFCCDTAWDQICANYVPDSCPDLVCEPPPNPCGDPNAGDCCLNNGTPGCDDAACCEAVCAFDAFCCDVQWDQICAGFVGDFVECEKACPPVEPTSDCCFASDEPGCDTASCESAVCTFNPSCCDIAWDESCAEIAGELCSFLCSGQCGIEGSGDCCAANGTPGCDDADCCTTVCNDDSFCCETAWDGICANLAAQMCQDLCGKFPTCGSPNTGDCCTATGSPACEDAACCEAVCAFDPFCCDVEWDQICADFVPKTCPGLCDGPACPADLDGSGTVDGGDLGILLGAWNTANSDADLDGSGNVDGGDLGILLGAWGPCK